MKKSYVQVYTGDGKGKTTAAIGLAVRALGRGKSVKFVQFLKGRNTGEMAALQKVDGAEFCQVSKCKKFFPDMTDEEKIAVRKEAADFFPKILSWLGKTDIMILDEIMAAISMGLVSLENVCELIEHRNGTELILTGRDAPQEIIAKADLVTEMRQVKHYFEKGVNAREGIEF